MRDPRFEALDPRDHRLLAVWAADCAERVLPLFEVERPEDERPRKALEVARAWARGAQRVGPARAAAVAAHAAAREVDEGAARAAARAAGHAVATAHMAEHALHAADYAVLAAQSAVERAWQLAHVPVHLRALVLHDGEPG